MAYSREVRLGIVLYGGVSLAIYENGVAQELFHSVHGNGVYALLKDLIDSDIIVDVISGTSAGGVNGIYLAYALANGKNFSQMSELWLEKGDIQKLLRQPNDRKTLSVLDSDFYQGALNSAFTDMRAYTVAHESRPSPMQELDLFVTGTDVTGEIYTVFDDSGHAIDVKKHNSVFQLSWRGTRKNEFKPAYAEELATLARITSCFPVAFAPVGINVANASNLQRWGRLQTHGSAVSGDPAQFDKVYMDGGILNNKPFSYTTDAITRRTANRPVQRFLFYVEPDPERFQAPQKVTQPGVVSAALDALINIPDYQSIGNDLATINAYNQQVKRISDLIDAASLGQQRSPDCLGDIAVVAPGLNRLYLNARLVQLRDRAVEGILNTDGQRECFTSLSVRRAGRILVESFLHASPGGGEISTLEHFDVYYRFRRLLHLTYSVSESTSTGVWDGLNHHLKCIEIVQWAMEWYIDHVPIEWKSLDASYSDPISDDQYAAIAGEKWGTAQRGLAAVLDTSHVAYPEQATANAREIFYSNLKTRIQDLVKHIPAEADPLPKGNLLIDSDALLQAFVSELSKVSSSDPLVHALCAFLAVDEQIFPIQFASGIASRDQIRVERLSPLDAKGGYSGRFKLEEKLAGKTLSSFGGFFKKSWRANDIMWGRLDAVSQIVTCTLTQARLNQINGSPLSLRVGNLATRLPGLFPRVNAKDAAQSAALAADLGKLANPALTKTEFDSIVDHLILTAQQEIVEEEWPKVIGCALEQERDWSSYGTVKALPATVSFDQNRLVWVDPKSTPDYLLVQVAAAAIARNQYPDFLQCKVAGRSLANEVPGPVLLQIASLAAMRLEKSVYADPKLPRIPVLHKSIFGLVVPGLYGWSTFHRSRPEWRIASSAALLALSIAVFALTIALWRSSLGTPYKLALLIGPLTVMVAWFWFFRPPLKSRLRVAGAVLVSLLLISLVIALILILSLLLQRFFPVAAH